MRALLERVQLWLVVGFSRDSRGSIADDNCQFPNESMNMSQFDVHMHRWTAAMQRVFFIFFLFHVIID
jgi:hypothetical protein